MGSSERMGVEAMITCKAIMTGHRTGHSALGEATEKAAESMKLFGVTLREKG